MVMEPQIPLTHESLAEFLTIHQNWSEVEPGHFEILEPDTRQPFRIDLEPSGARFYFLDDAAEPWSFLAGEQRFCAYKNLLIEPLDSLTGFKGCLMMNIQYSLVPPPRGFRNQAGAGTWPPTNASLVPGIKKG